MNRECKCGGFLGIWDYTGENSKLYKDLFQCLDCGKDYILKNGEYKQISKAEFRRIINSRKSKLNNNRNEGEQ